jgi:hypothetical protein
MAVGWRCLSKWRERVGLYYITNTILSTPSPSPSSFFLLELGADVHMYTCIHVTYKTVDELHVHCTCKGGWRCDNEIPVEVNVTLNEVK